MSGPESVLRSFAGVGSVVPAGAVTVAVFVNAPRASASIVASTMIVAVPSTGRSRPTDRIPVPFGPEHAPPALVVHVHVAAVNVRGRASFTRAPTTVDGPLFFTASVYRTGEPGTSAPVCVFTISRSATGARFPVSVEASFPALGSEVPEGTDAVAVFTTVPRASAAMVASTTNVAEAPGARFTGVAMLPVPPGNVQAFAGPAGTSHVHAAEDSETGSGSFTSAPATADGPRLVTVMAHRPTEPGTNGPTWRLSTLRSLTGTKFVESDAALLVASGSVTELGEVTDAVLDNVPRDVGSTMAVTTNVATAPFANDTWALMFPAPVVLAHDEPSEAEQVQDALVSALGSES